MHIFVILPCNCLISACTDIVTCFKSIYKVQKVVDAALKKSMQMKTLWTRRCSILLLYFPCGRSPKVVPNMKKLNSLNQVVWQAKISLFLFLLLQALCKVKSLWGCLKHLCLWKFYLKGYLEELGNRNYPTGQEQQSKYWLLISCLQSSPKPYVLGEM